MTFGCCWNPSEKIKAKQVVQEEKVNFIIINYYYKFVKYLTIVELELLTAKKFENDYLLNF